MKENSILSLFFEPQFDAIFINPNMRAKIEDNIKIIYPNDKSRFFFISDEEINFLYTKTDNIKKQEKEKINGDRLIEPTKFSKYFFDYFEYNEREKLKRFLYFKSKGRERFSRALAYVFRSPEIKFFKFCGPPSIGKSTTLINFKNSHKGVIYFNFKIINKYEENKKSYFEMMNYELQNLKFSNSAEKEGFISKQGEIFFYKTFEDIFVNLFENLKNLNEKNMIIFDQFKPNKYFSKKTYKKIEDYVKNSKLKLIISCSINDKEVKTELIKTLNTFGCIPYIPLKKFEDYYLYVEDIININDLKDLYLKEYKYSQEEIKIFDQFNFIPKYIYFFKKNGINKKAIIHIDNHIKEKINKLFPNFTMEVIVRIVKNFLNKTFPYTNENTNILFWVPLKYFNLHLKHDFFYVDYAFPYIKNLFDSISDEYNIRNYFEKKLYNKEIYEQLKEVYFERYLKNAIINNNFNFFNEKITHFLTVNNLVNLEDLEEPDNNIIKLIDNINNKTLENSITYKKSIESKISLIQTKLDELNDIIDENNIDFYFKSALEEKLEQYNQILESKDDKTFKKPVKINNYNDDFKNGVILIDQKQVNGRCIDQIFLSGNKDQKLLICLQMKFYMPSTTLSSDYRKTITKKNIRKKCQNLLANSFLHFGITIKKWYYYFIFHFNKKENEYNHPLVNLCKAQDLDYFFFDPILKKFFGKDFEEIDNIPITLLSNLIFEDLKNNPYTIFKHNYDLDYMFRKRNRELVSEDSYIPEKNSNNLCKTWEKKYNLSFEKFFKKIKKTFKGIKDLEPINVLKMDYNLLPPLNEGYGFIFLDSSQKNLIFYANLKDDENITIFKEGLKKDIMPIEIGAYIYNQKGFEYFVIKIEL